MPSSSGRGARSGIAETGAGVLLGALFWTLVGLPLITGGPDRVKAMIQAKFFNKTPDGGWLP